MARLADEGSVKVEGRKAITFVGAIECSLLRGTTGQATRGRST